MPGWQQQVVRHVVVDGGVLVGDDGSEGAGAALRYAAEEAVRRRGLLHVLRAWSLATGEDPPDAERGYVPPLEDVEAATREVVRRRATALVEVSRLPVDDLRVHVAHAAPARALVEASSGADVLVVGTRGRGGFARLLLGSTADQCVRHAACPVVVVR
ncbi:universal stress protein [Pseudokineococcus sp. 5B2Z-1]|uniref:universal stress protein n=1 Tax=Pseudokineococcus sp. 5B2Z-1 TaxID=3132744 RepID=UPI0030A43AF1